MINVVTSPLNWQEVVESAPPGEEKKKVGSSFYRGENCNFVPYGKDHDRADFAERFILKGWLPPEPVIDQRTVVTAFGSCFAENISNHLARIGFDTSKRRNDNTYVTLMGEGLVNVHAIVQQFRWALTEWVPPSNLWHGYKAEEYDISEEIRRNTRRVFLETEVFILTFGLSEIWYDAVTGGVFWRAVPMKHFDAARHRFRVCSFAETKACISEIVGLIREHVPRARIVMTVSPIPLITTFRPISCVTANSVSKSLLRAALDEAIRDLDAEGRRMVHYFPAFELVNECFPNRFGEDGRHLHPMIVPAIMRLFEAGFCQTDLTLEEAERGFRQARLDNVGTLASHPLFSQAPAAG